MKKLLLIAAFLLSGIICLAQEKPFNTVLTIGHTFQNDISFTVGGRVSKEIYVTCEHGYSFATKCQRNYIGIGLGNDKQIILIKYGATTEPYEGTHINYTDYGVEYLWTYIIRYKEKKILYGLTVTKRTGAGFKVGLAF